MSKTYTDLPGTVYPDSIDAFEDKEDADIGMYPYMKQYKELFNQGNLTGARALLNTYPQLKNMLITAEDFNNLQNAMIAMERFMKREQQQIIFSASEPSGASAQAVGDVWVKLKDGGNELYEKTTSGYVLRLSNPTTVAQANKLATARKIGNANFDGTANITLAQIGAATAAQGTKADNITTDIKYIKYVTALPSSPSSDTLYLVKK